MLCIRNILTAGLLAAMLPAASAPLAAEVELTFLPNRSVRQTSRLSLAIEEELPTGAVKRSMEQRLVADLTIVDRSDLPVSRPPINMLFTLRDLEIALSSGGATASFSIKSPGTSLFLAEIQNMMNDPIKLHFGKNFSLDPHTNSLQQLAKELPILQAIHPHSFVEEFFRHLFALADRELVVGKEVTVSTSGGSIGLSPASLTYLITAIDPDTISATFSGKSSKEKFGIPIEIAIGEANFDGVEFTVAADLQGTLSWSRHNALLYTLDQLTTYQGSYRVGQWKSAIAIREKHAIKSEEAAKRL